MGVSFQRGYEVEREVSYCNNQFCIRFGHSQYEGMIRILILDNDSASGDYLVGDRRSSDFELSHAYNSIEEAELAIVRYQLSQP